MSYVTLSCIISVWIFSFVVSDTSFGQESANQLASLDLYHRESMGDLQQDMSISRGGLLQ
jgi:hypothetical protein